MAQIECSGITLGYDGHAVSEGLSFTVESGDYLCIVGENGSGKSTLMKTLLHLMPPMKGEIVLGDGLRYGEIGYLPQQNDLKRDFPASVWEVVLSGCIGRGRTGLFLGKEEKETARKNLERMGVEGLATRPYSTLSGGQQQRVLLARALCAAGKLLLLDEPVAGKLLLLDEPVAGLDPNATEELYETVARLNREDGITIVMITHDLSAVVRYATKVLHMSATPTYYAEAETYFHSADFPRCRCGREDA